jgi:lactate dehydrogenase-like 2-hydroxyacid dehydrogenase
VVYRAASIRILNTFPGAAAMTKPHLMMTGPLMPLIMEGVAKTFTVHKIWEAADRAQAITEIAPHIEAIAHSGSSGIKVDDAFLARFPRLKAIGNMGVGYDSIDATACGRRGVIVSNTPDVLNEEVADTALGLLLMTVRELGQSEAWLRAGKWATDGDYPLTRGTLRDRSVGMVGYGRIGKAIAKRVEAFGVPVSYFSRTRQPDVTIPYHGSIVEMAKAVDTLIVITPGGPSTTNLVNADVLAALGPRGVLINIARGSVVDEAALIAALRAGTIHAAGLDVMWGEPKLNPELMTLRNCVLLPHVGSASVWTRDKMGQLVVDNLAAYAGRTPPLTPVTETPFKGW